jgi:predicted TIM-barrel fold metal-dependent hydrolase
MLVDAHCHASDVWFEPVEPLVFQMDQNGVDKAVLTQLLGQYNNEYQEQCVKRYPGRFASVVMVDPTQNDGPETVGALAKNGAVGIRLRPEARSPGADPHAIWRAAGDNGLVVSCGGLASHMLSKDFGVLLEALPDLPIVLEHLGGWSRPDCDQTTETRAGIAAMARYPNIYLKVPTLGQLAKRGPKLPPSGRVLDLEPADIVLEMLERFGADRLMWGSDFPPVASREGYANALNWTREVFHGQPQEVIDKVFGDTAKKVFGLSGD